MGTFKTDSAYCNDAHLIAHRMLKLLAKLLHYDCCYLDEFGYLKFISYANGKNMYGNCCQIISFIYRKEKTTENLVKMKFESYLDALRTIYHDIMACKTLNVESLTAKDFYARIDMNNAGEFLLGCALHADELFAYSS